jgi:methyl-accepting chemotaxis protein
MEKGQFRFKFPDKQPIVRQAIASICKTLMVWMSRNGSTRNQALLEAYHEAASEITGEINSVSEISTPLNGSSTQVNQSAEELKRLANELNVLVGTFKYQNRRSKAIAARGIGM